MAHKNISLTLVSLFYSHTPGRTDFAAGQEASIRNSDLLMRTALVASITPGHQVVHPGQHVVLNCTTFGYPITTISWLKDGRFLHSANHDPAGHLLEIRAASKDDEGSYQCVARNNFESTQATATLVLGGQ